MHNFLQADVGQLIAPGRQWHCNGSVPIGQCLPDAAQRLPGGVRVGEHRQDVLSFVVVPDAHAGLCFDQWPRVRRLALESLPLRPRRSESRARVLPVVVSGRSRMSSFQGSKCTAVRRLSAVLDECSNASLAYVSFFLYDCVVIGWLRSG